MPFRPSYVLRSSAQAGPGAWSSKFGPTLKSRLQFGGVPLAPLARYATAGAGFGAAALIAVAFLFEDVPVVRKDIYQKIPIIGGYWEKQIAPEDNPF